MRNKVLHNTLFVQDFNVRQHYSTYTNPLGLRLTHA